MFTPKSQSGLSVAAVCLFLIFFGILISWLVMPEENPVKIADYREFISWEQNWKLRQYLYRQRKGRFAGDENGNGLIADSPEEAGALWQLEKLNWKDKLSSTYSIKNKRLRIFFASANVQGKGSNFLVIVHGAYPEPFPAKLLPYIRDLDKEIDDQVHAQKGILRGYINATMVRGRLTDLGKPSSRAYTNASLVCHFLN